MVKIEQLRNKVLDVVLENFDYFKENPRHLAWAMMNYELIHRVGRVNFHECDDNPKDLVIEYGEKLKNKNDSNLMYDAWGVTVSNFIHEFEDTSPEIPLESKINKTLDEWVEVCMDKRFRFNEICPDRFSVEDHILCVSGNGYGWNKDGFACEDGPCGTDEDIFAGYTRAEKEVREDIRNNILELRDNLKIKEYTQALFKKAMENEKRIYNGEEWLDVMRGQNPLKESNKKLQKTLNKLLEGGHSVLPQDLKKDLQRYVDGLDDKRKELKREEERSYYPIDEYSLMVTMPANVHPSYIEAGKRIAKEILEDPEQEKRSKTLARKFLEKWA